MELVLVNYDLLIALGLMFGIGQKLVTNATWRIAVIVVSAVMFALAVIVVAFGSPW